MPGSYGAPGRPEGTGGLRVEPVPGTEFAVAYLPVRPTVYGAAVGSLVGGIGSVLVGLFVLCLGITPAGPLATGAFTVTASLFGVGALVVGLSARRHVAASGGAYTGRGLAMAGLVCGAIGFGLGLLGLLLAALHLGR